MIAGRVNTHWEAVVRLAICTPDGAERSFDAIVDTGFNGSLTLPAKEVASLALPWRSRGSVVLANGAEEECDIFAATIIWDGMPRKVLVESAETEPLIGMNLLRGFELCVQVKDGGSVTLTPLVE